MITSMGHMSCCNPDTHWFSTTLLLWVLLLLLMFFICLFVFCTFTILFSQLLYSVFRWWKALMDMMPQWNTISKTFISLWVCGFHPYFWNPWHFAGINHLSCFPHWASKFQEVLLMSPSSLHTLDLRQDCHIILYLIYAVAPETWIWKSDWEKREWRRGRHTYRKCGVRWVVHTDGDALTTPATRNLSAFVTHGGLASLHRRSLWSSNLEGRSYSS